MDQSLLVIDYASNQMFKIAYSFAKFPTITSCKNCHVQCIYGTCSLPHFHDLIVHPNTQRSIAEVEWGTSGSSNIYRVGHKGKVDLKCDTPGDGGEYYPDHLPMLGGFCVV